MEKDLLQEIKETAENLIDGINKNGGMFMEGIIYNELKYIAMNVSSLFDGISCGRVALERWAGRSKLSLMY